MANISFKNRIQILKKISFLISNLLKHLIPKEQTTSITILKSDIVNALKISTIFSDKFNQLTLTVDTEKKQCSLYSKNGDVGENNTLIDAVISGESIAVSLNHKYVVDCFQSISVDSISVSLTQPNKPVVIRGISDASFMYLIMPMNR